MRALFRLSVVSLTTFLLSACGGGEKPNTPPTISVSPASHTVLGREVISVTPSLFDADGDTLTLTYTQTSNREGVLLAINEQSSDTLRFTAPDVSEPTTFSVTLTVDDGEDTASSTITVKTNVAPPLPVAKSSYKGDVAATVRMDNPEPYNIAVLKNTGSVGINTTWSIESAPINSNTEITQPYSPTTGFYASLPGEYKIKLSMDNANHEVATSYVTVKVVSDLDGDGLDDSNDSDADGDGFDNDEDAFPFDKSSHRDSDGDGVSNYLQADEDGDGVLDQDDAFPFDPEKSELPLITEGNDSNSNDGTRFAVQAGAAPMQIRGELLGSVSYDQDYYALTLAAGRVTVNLQLSGNAVPVFSFIDEQSNQVAFIEIENFTPSTKQFSAVIPTPGTYYVALANNFGDKADIDYSLSLFYDKDQDGVSDDIEIALDSNELNADSDSDGILDGVEIATLRTVVGADPDYDGVPAWWDLDSDGDGISDRLEGSSLYPADPDGDGLMNFIDLDSDGNGIDDSVEFGDLYGTPTDTDGNNVPDYLDVDNDGDGIPDSQDDTMNTYTPASALTEPAGQALQVTSFKNQNGEFGNTCLVGDTLTVTLSNPALQNDAAVYARTNGENMPVKSNLVSPTEIDIICEESRQGVASYIIVSSGKRSDDFAIEVLPAKQLVVGGVYVDNNIVKITGRNLDTELTFNFGSRKITFNNTGGTADAFQTGIPWGADLNEFWISSDRGTTEPMKLNRKSTSSTQLTISAPAGIDVNSAVISTAKGDLPIVGGLVNYVSLENAAEVVSISIQDSDRYYTIAMTPILPGARSVDVNATTTALGVLWLVIDIDWSAADRENHLNNLMAMPEVIQLGEMIYSNLSANNTYLLSFDLYRSPEYMAAVNAVQLYAESVSKNIQNSSSLKPVILPEQELDDIAILFNDTDQPQARWKIENDTALYIAFKAIDKNGNVVCRYGSGLFSDSYISPQTSWPRFDAQSVSAGCIGAQDATVTVVTPGFETKYTPSLPAFQLEKEEQAVIAHLVTRTMIDGVIVPIIQGALDVMDLKVLDSKTVASIAISHTPWLANEVLELVSGGQSIEKFNQDVGDNLVKDFLDKGPLTDALIAAISKRFPLTSAAISEMIAKRIATSSIPVVGQIYAIWKTAKGPIVSGISVAKFATDYISTDAAIDFKVNFPLQIESVSPRFVHPDGKIKTINIYGQGFKPLPTFFGLGEPVEPIVKLTNERTKNTIEYAPKFISGYGDQIVIDVPGIVFSQIDDTFSVQVIQPEDDMLHSNILTQAITVSNELRITDITPYAVGPNDTILISGSGFNTQPNLNIVKLNDNVLSTLSVTEDGIRVRLPMQLDPGTYTVTVTVGDKVSNALHVTITAAQVTIRVCDNGGLKDDNFALDINGVRVGQTRVTNSNYCFNFPVTVSSGTHTAMLSGLDAPDGIGTYSIEFFGATNVRGDSRSGGDLAPGSRPKVFQFDVSPTEPASLMIIPLSVPSSRVLEE